MALTFAIKMASNQLLDERTAKKINKSDGSAEKVLYSSSSEYCEALNNWMVECNRWYAYHALFPYYVAQHLEVLKRIRPSANANVNENISSSQAQSDSNRARPNDEWTDYKIASIWKRIGAEIIDFLLLFMVKFFITFIAVDFFQIIDIDRYSKALSSDNFDQIPFHILLELSTELMLLEIVNRLVICVFEACFLKCGQMPGGATPGKRIMGIKVISYKSVIWHFHPESGQVKIQTASDLGLWRAFGRSIIKNISFALCLPVSFTVRMFQFNRALYDVIFNCIVVEDPNNRQNWQPRLFA